MLKFARIVSCLKCLQSSTTDAEMLAVVEELIKIDLFASIWRRFWCVVIAQNKEAFTLFIQEMERQEFESAYRSLSLVVANTCEQKNRIY